MRSRDLLQRARRMLAQRGGLIGVVHLFREDAPDGQAWKTVDMAKYPPGPKRDALLEGAVVFTETHEWWVELMAKEDEEEARNATP